MSSPDTSWRTLRPGLPVLLRDEDWIQVGADPSECVVLPATPAVRETLAALQAGRGRLDDEVLAVLAHEGRLCDARLVHRHDPDPAVRAAVVARHPAPEAAMASRAAYDVQVVGHRCGTDPAAQDALERVVDLATRLLDQEGVRGGDRPAGLLLSIGEPDRGLTDDWLRDGVAHLVVRLLEGIALIGPFVVPGVSACLRCLDAHRTDADPLWPLLLAQLTAPVRRGDGVPEPADPALQALAVSWAVRDLTSYVEGRRPATWSATLRLTPDLAETESIAWLRHPGCGCAWDEYEPA